MATYCGPKEEKEILDELNDAQDIVLFGCRACANFYYAITHQSRLEADSKKEGVS